MIKLQDYYQQLQNIKDIQKLYLKALDLNHNFKLFYYEVDKKYPFLVLDNFLFDFNFYHSPKKFDDLRTILITMKNKIIINLKNYNSDTEINLYEYTLLQSKLINLPKPDIIINNDNFLKQINNNILITQNEIDLLNSIGINAYDYSSLDNIIYDLNEILETEKNEELEYLLMLLEERKYYEQAHK